MSKNKLEEIQKCINSPYYFFTTYCVIDGKNAKTVFTEDEFNRIFRSLVKRYSRPTVMGN